MQLKTVSHKLGFGDCRVEDSDNSTGGSYWLRAGFLPLPSTCQV